jgi:hypothetical protein
MELLRRTGGGRRTGCFIVLDDVQRTDPTAVVIDGPPISEQIELTVQYRYALGERRSATVILAEIAEDLVRAVLAEHLR